MSAIKSYLLMVALLVTVAVVSYFGLVAPIFYMDNIWGRSIIRSMAYVCIVAPLLATFLAGLYFWASKALGPEGSERNA